MREIVDKLNEIFSLLDVSNLLSPIKFGDELKLNAQMAKKNCGFCWKMDEKEKITLFLHESDIHNSSMLYYLSEMAVTKFCYQNNLKTLLRYLTFDYVTKGYALVVTCLPTIPVETLDKILDDLSSSQAMEIETDTEIGMKPTASLTSSLSQTSSPVFSRPSLKRPAPVDPELYSSHKYGRGSP